MAYDRYEARDRPRDEHPRWRDEPSGRHQNDRGFFDRAGDEVASWFGDEDAERRRREDRRFGDRERGFGRDWNRGSDRDLRREDYRGRQFGNRSAQDRDHELSGSSGFSSDDDRGSFGRSSYRGYSGEGGRTRSPWANDRFGGAPGAERGYEPEFGGYTVSEGLNAPADYPRNRPFDPHYHSWRQRELDRLDRDYDEYRRERQREFESDFGSWRERRQQKRSLLGQIREHMEVVGSDDEHVGTVDRVAGDRIILAKSDAESGGVHHSLSCSDIDRVEGDRVVLGTAADKAKELWRDESRSRALFEREDQGEMGPRALNRSFEGTYRDER